MIYLILSILASTITVSFFKIFEIKGVNTLQAIVFNYITCAILGNLISAETPVILTAFYKKDWFLYTFLLGFLFITIFFAIGKTSQSLGVSVSMVSAKLSVLMPILFAVIFYNESLSAIQIVGIVVSLLAVYFISQKEGVVAGKSPYNWMLPLLVFVGSGIIDTTLNIIQKKYIPAVSEAYVITTVFSVAFVLGSLFLIYLMIFKNEKIALKSIYWGFLLGLPNYFSMFFLVKTLSAFNNESAMIFSVNNIGIVLFSTLFSVLIFKEFLNKKNIIGLALAIVAIVFISIKF